MDDRGNIKQFETMEQAKKEGYIHELTAEQATEFLNYPQGERLMCLAWNKHFDALDIKPDTIEKIRMRQLFFAGYKAAKGKT